MLAVPTYSRERVSSLSSSPSAFTLTQPYSTDAISSPSPQRLFAHTDAASLDNVSNPSTLWSGGSPKKYQRYKATVPTIYPSSYSSPTSATHRPHPARTASPRATSPVLQVTPHLYGRTDSPYTKFDVYEHYHYAVSPLPAASTPVQELLPSAQQTPQKTSHLPHPEHEQRVLTRVTATTSMSDLLQQRAVSPDPTTIETIRHLAEENALARQDLVRQWMTEKANASSPAKLKAGVSDAGSSTRTTNGESVVVHAASRPVRRASLYEPKNKEVFAKWLLAKQEAAQRQAVRDKKRREQNELSTQAKTATAAASRQANFAKWAGKKAKEAAEARALQAQLDAAQAAEAAAALERQSERRLRAQSMPLTSVALKLAKHQQPWVDLLPPQIQHDEEDCPRENRQAEVLSPPSLYNDYALNIKHTTPHYIASHRLWIAHAGQEVAAAKRAEARRSHRQAAGHTRWAPKSNAGRCLHHIL